MLNRYLVLAMKVHTRLVSNQKKGEHEPAAGMYAHSRDHAKGINFHDIT